jgi:hypothetical protein
MSLVPLPWCTSQSRISTRSTPCAAVARRAATATLLKKQKAHGPRPLRRGGRAGARAAKPVGASPPSSASTSATAPPAACIAASNVAPTAAVSRSIIPPPRALQILDERDVLLGVHGVQLLALRPRRLDPLEAEPVVVVELGLERDDPLRSLGVPGDVVAQRRVVPQPDGTASHAGYRTPPLSAAR